jgi:hypothetical protein
LLLLLLLLLLCRWRLRSRLHAARLLWHSFACA